MIQIHRLEGFYWVARTGGYARAARAFPYPITQPAVHQQVRKLETELGLQLFERVGKDRMQLTAAGRKLYDFAAPFFEGMPALVRALQSGEFGGALSIHAAPLFVRRLLPEWLKRLQGRRPDAQVQLHEMPQLDFELLRSGVADVLVDHLPEVPDDVATLGVGTLRPYVVLPQSHPLARRRKIGLADLVAETFIAYNPGLLPHQLQMRALAQHGIVPQRTLSAGSADAILDMVASGLGYSIVPAIAPAGPKAEGVVAIALSEPEVTFPVVAAWRKDTPENPLLDAFLESAPGNA